MKTYQMSDKQSVHETRAGSISIVPYLLDSVLTKIQAGFNKVVLPLNIDRKHWVGLIIENNGNHLNIVYLDSENKEMPFNAQVALSVACAQKGYQVALAQ